MRALPVCIGALTALTLGCGFLSSLPSAFEADPQGSSEPSPFEGAPASAPPEVVAAPVSAEVVGAPSRGEPVKLIQDPQVTIVNPEIPPDLVLGEVASDYEHLSRTGTIESCPEGTTLQEKKGTDGEQVFCGIANGVRHGPWIAFWPNGKVREIGPYVKGFRHGSFATWNSHGKLNSRYTWTNGQIGAGQVY